LIYLLVAFVLARSGWVTVLLAACLVCTGVEFSRLLDFDWLNAFRDSLAGKLTIGAVFSLWNLPAYFAGCALAALSDERWIRARTG